MQNFNSIDNLVKQTLENGEERLNLGAWANMERMLDGQNPYATKPEDTNNKKRIFWLFGSILLGIGLLSVGLFQAFKHNKNNYVQNNTNTDKVVVAKPINQQNELNTRNTNTNSNSETPPIISPPTTTSNTQNQPINNSNTATKQIVSTKVKSKKVKNNFTNNIIVNNDKINDKINNNINQNNANTSTDNVTSIENAVATSPVVNKKTKFFSSIFNKNKNKNNKNLQDNYTSNNNLEINNSVANTMDNNSKAITTNDVQSKNSKSKKEKKNNSLAIKSSNNTKSNKPNDSIVVINKTISTTKNEDGQKVDVAKVTISKVEAAKKLDVENSEINSEEQKPQVVLAPEESNPRLKKLSATEDAKANAKPSKNAIAKKLNTLETNTALDLSSIKQMETPTKNTKPEAKKTADSWMNTTMENLINTAKKVGYIKLFNQKLYVNPGVFAGINGSFFNTEHNLGGFQAGANVMMQIAKNLNIIPHVGFYYRNNGGYSLKDNSYTISNKNTAINFDNAHSAYNYQKDSSTISYNFNHIYSIEAPILINYSKRDFGFYAGVNLAYGLKMNTQNFSNNYIVQRGDTLPTASAYAFPANSSYVYKSTDFQSRFGVGYVVGMSYDFHPNLYVDLRLVKNAWDNSTTASAIQISNKIFKVPSLQLGICYRFKERERVRYK